MPRKSSGSEASAWFCTSIHSPSLRGDFARQISLQVFPAALPKALPESEEERSSLVQCRLGLCVLLPRARLAALWKGVVFEKAGSPLHPQHPQSPSWSKRELRSQQPEQPPRTSGALRRGSQGLGRVGTGPGKFRLQGRQKLQAVAAQIHFRRARSSELIHPGSHPPGLWDRSPGEGQGRCCRSKGCRDIPGGILFFYSSLS